MSIAQRQLESGVPEQSGQDLMSLRREHKAITMLALDQISHEQVSDRRMVTPACSQSVSEARQNSRTRSDRVRAAAMLSVVGALAIASPELQQT